jgi:hypothetical protein
MTKPEKRCRYRKKLALLRLKIALEFIGLHREAVPQNSQGFNPGLGEPKMRPEGGARRDWGICGLVRQVTPTSGATFRARFANQLTQG